MEFLAEKKKILILISVIIAVLFFGNYIFAYDETIVHPSLTEDAAKLYNLNYSDKLTEQEINWIRQGSIDEDKVWGGIRQIRSSNHFYNPSGIKEWKDYNLDSKIPAYFSSGIGNGSKQWAHDSVAQSQYVDGDYTWERAIWDYANGDRKHAYESLGHILHLIEDETVPAHVRNDFHLSPKELEAYQNWLVVRNFVDYEPYEAWTGSQAKSKELKFDFSDNLFQENKKPIIFPNLDNYFDSVAIYANTKFFSKDTIYVYSEPNNNVVEGSEKISNGDIVNYQYGIDVDGKTFKLARFFKDGYTNQGKYAVDNNTPEIHSDYWSRLAPRSILASAGIINLFKIEAEKAKNSGVALAKPDDYKSFYFVKPAANSANQAKITAIAFYNWQISIALNVYKAATSVAAPAYNQAKLFTVSVFNSVRNIASAFYNSAKSTIAVASSSQSQIGSFFNSVLGAITQYFSPNANASAKLTFDISQPIKVPTIAEIYQAAQAADAPDGATPENSDYGGELILSSSEDTISAPGEALDLELGIKNTGTAIWESGQIFLGALNDGNSQNFYHSSWVNRTTPSRLFEPLLLPDRIGKFFLTLKAPDAAGDYFFSARPMRKNSLGDSEWIGLDIAKWQIKVEAKDVELEPDEDIAENNPAPEDQNADSALSPSPEPSIIPSPSPNSSPAPTSTPVVSYSGSYSNSSGQGGGSSSQAAPAPSISPSLSPTLSPIISPTPSPSVSPSPSPSLSPSISPSPSLEPSVSPAPSIEPTVSPSPSPSPSLSPTPDVSPAPTASPNISPTPTPKIPAIAEYPVVSEIQLGGINPDDEFIEIYNPSNSIARLKDWSIQYRGGEAKKYYKKNFSSGDIIPANGYFLIAHKDKDGGYDGEVFPDMTWGQSLSGIGGTIFLSKDNVLLTEETDAGEAVVDKIAWGQGKEPSEGEKYYLRGETEEFMDTPSGNQSMERKAYKNSDSASMASGGLDEFMGNGWDSNNNSEDFVLRETPDPQNSESLAEPFPKTVHNISRNIDYPRIQWAIDDAKPGDEIRADSGVYLENIIVGKQVILKGADTGGGNPVIRAIKKGSIVKLTADGVTIDRFSIIGSSLSNEGIYAVSNNNAITNNTISEGVIYINSSGNIIAGNAVNSENTCFLLNDGDNNKITGNNFSNCQTGLYIDKSDSNIISDNIANFSKSNGIVLDASRDNIVSGNIVESGDHYGIEIIGSNNNIINKNISSKNRDGLILVNSFDNTITENTFSLNKSRGIYSYERELR